DSHEPIEVRVLPGRIEILSHPGADRSISQKSLENYRMACRRYRNRRIGEFLKELGLTEGRNTGIHKILKSLRENGSPEPLFETDEERLYFMITLYARQDSDTKAVSKPTSKLQSRSQKLAARKAAILGYCAENPTATITQIVEGLGIPRATLGRAIALLKAEGLLERADENGLWTVRN
ncbi:MAG: ATP-binding protein, partial [Raoultibacter sp.]